MKFFRIVMLMAFNMLFLLGCGGGDSKGGGEGTSSASSSLSSSVSSPVSSLSSSSRSSVEFSSASSLLVVSSSSLAVMSSSSSGTVSSNSATSYSASSVLSSSSSSSSLEGIPPDPATVAPAIDPTVATTMDKSTAFLYTGDDPIQTGVLEGTIKAVQAAVLRGKVLDRADTPLSGVTISVLDHPEFGQTLSRADGMFDMAVNGGGYLTLKYEKAGYLPVQRQINTPWQDFAIADDVVMIALDAQVTQISMAGSDIQIARGSSVSDEDGARQATLLFKPGTTAELVLPDGSTQSMNSLNIRATEYTVGDNGPQAMPAVLPSYTAYTYCVELSADEAIEANASEIRFNQPIYTYVENFIGAPVGTAVPTGYYDRLKGQWIASENGRVIEMLGTDGDLAQLDTDGDGVEDNASLLADLNITDSERQNIAALYTAGQTLWRVPMEHLTPWDHNWPYGPPDDSGPPLPDPDEPSDPDGPPPPEPEPEDPEEEFCPLPGSIIECQNQILGERIAITGTPYFLQYQSDRMVGDPRSRTIDIPLSTSDIPDSLTSIELTVSVAGRQFFYTFPAESDQSYTFVWDGKDAYDRQTYGKYTAVVDIEYVYPAVYYGVGPGFANAFNRVAGGSGASSGGGGGSVMTFVPRRATQEIGIPRHWSVSIGTSGNGDDNLGGWSLSAHHRYDFTGSTLYYGGGMRQGSKGHFNVSTFAGTAGSGSDTDSGIPALEAKISPLGLETAEDGSLFFAQKSVCLIRKIDPEGNLTTVAGDASDIYNSCGSSEDGGEANATKLSGPRGISVADDGTLYVAEYSGHIIRKVAPDGIVSTFAGTKDSQYETPEVPYNGQNADGIVLRYPDDVVVGLEGSVYIVDYNGVHKVDSAGKITTLIGGGGAGFTEGMLGTDLRVTEALALAVGDDGSVYTSIGSGSRVIKLDIDGTLSSVTGEGYFTKYVDYVFAKEAPVGKIEDIELLSNGGMFLAATQLNRVLYIAPDGIISTIAGSGKDSFGDENDPSGDARGFDLGSPAGLALGADKRSLYISDSENRRIYQLRSPFPSFENVALHLASYDGEEIFEFDANGRHQSTLDAVTGVSLFHFDYDDFGSLSSIFDRFGNQTTIERDADGNPTAIIAPFGERTELLLNAEGYLSQITNPAGESVDFTYHAGGLLATMNYPKGGTSLFTFDDNGALIKDQDPLGGFLQLSKTETDDGYIVTTTTAMGRTTTHTQKVTAGGKVTMRKTNPDGTWVETVISNDENESVHYADGTIITTRNAPDPRFGMQAPYLASMQITTPGGIVGFVEQNRSVILQDSNDAFSLTALEENLTINGKTYSNAFDVNAGTLTHTTPEGVMRQLVFNDNAQVEQVAMGGAIDPVIYTYDAHGRVSTMSQGTQSWHYTYDGVKMDTLTTAADQVVHYGYDAADRMTSVTTPLGVSAVKTYDANGNMQSLTMPSGDTHTLSYTNRNLLSAYAAPDSTGLSHSYNLDRARTATTLASGTTVTNTFDSAGRWTSVSYPAALVTMSYQSDSDKLSMLYRNAASGNDQTLAYDYDGNLPTLVRFEGAAEGNFTYTYGENMQVSQIRLVSGSDDITTTMTHDNDNKVMSYGDFAFTRNAAQRKISVISDANADLAFVYDAHGRISGKNYTIAGSERYSYAVTYSNIGQITQKTERVDGNETIARYSYDADGQLLTVTVDGTLTESYTYDENGNRISTLEGGSTYSTQDYQLTLGATGYLFDEDGYLEQRGADQFHYSARGELLSAVLDGGQTITYDYDGYKRRMARNSTAGRESYLYGNLENPFMVTAIRHTDGTLSELFFDEEGLYYAMKKAGSMFYIATDQVGTPRLVVDGSGTVIKTLHYDSYGKLIGDSNPGFDLPIGYAGGIADRDTGLVRFGFRDYDTASGRWTARDPILFEGNQANLYVYVGNNPVSLRDPMGLYCIGGSAFLGFGGGAEYCSQNGQESLCVNLGVGAGYGASISPNGGAENEGSAIVADASVGCFGLGLNGRGEYLMENCRPNRYRLSGGINFGFGGYSRSIASDGETGDSFGFGSNLPDANCGAVGSLTYRHCWRLSD